LHILGRPCAFYLLRDADQYICSKHLQLGCAGVFAERKRVLDKPDGLARLAAVVTSALA
jgi:hypothetical protein